MKISYKMHRFYPSSFWCCDYTLIDPAHTTINGTQSSIFKKGDFIDLAFPTGHDQGHPIYSNVQAAATADTNAWNIRVNLDLSGIDFGFAYRVVYTALGNNAVLNKFYVYFLWKASGIPGSQPWGFTNYNSPKQHDELGQTIPA